MKIPTNCDLFINDCVIDPQDWTSLIHFNNPNIHVCRSFGIHPKTIAPKAFFTRLTYHLRDVANNFPIAGYGPFGSISTDTPEFSPDLEKLLSNYQHIKNTLNMPIIISNQDSDSQTHSILKQNEYNAPIIWQNINNNSIDRFVNFTKSILPTNDLYMFSINGRGLEYKYANQIQHILRDKSILKRLLLGTDCPQYAANYTRQLISHPLHIANMVLELHLILIKNTAFKNYSLADTNDLLTSNAFSVFPRRLFNDLHIRSFENYTKKTIGVTLDDYKSLIGYSSVPKQTNTPIKTTPATKRSAANRSSEPTTPAAKKQCLDASIQTTQTPIDCELSRSRGASTPTSSQSKSSSTTTTKSTNITDTHSELDPDVIILAHNTDIPATQRQQLALPEPPSSQSPSSSSYLKDKTNSSSLKENKFDLSILNETDNTRLRKVINRAFEICYPGFSDPKSPTWSTSKGGSRIQILRPPVKLIQSMAKQSENMNEEELDKFLAKHPVPDPNCKFFPKQT